MSPILRNILAVIVEMVVNMGIVMLSSSIISLPKNGRYQSRKSQSQYAFV